MRAVVLLALGLAGCGGTASESGPAPEPEGIVVIRPDTNDIKARAVSKTLLQGIKVLAVGDSLTGLTGDETVSISGLSGDLKPQDIVPAVITRADGSSETIELLCRIDTEVEIEYVENGGVLHYVLRNLAKAA